MDYLTIGSSITITSVGAGWLRSRIFHDKVPKTEVIMSDGMPQFTTAEYVEKTGPSCKICAKPISGDYYQVNGATACASCALALRQQFTQDSHAAFVRGVIFGIGGAILGLAIYVAFALGTGLVIGYVSLAVGFIVGKAVTVGSGGRRGRRYQIAAVLLTYIAVSLSAVPIFISQQFKRQGIERPTPSNDSSIKAPTTVKMSPFKAIGMLAVVGLASPFLALSDPMHGVIGLVILFVGLRIAWTLTAARPLRILGPIGAAAPGASI
jgi:hypothetical protein